MITLHIVRPGVPLVTLTMPFEMEIELRVEYKACLYCGNLHRREKFCCDSHRVRYCTKRIAEAAL